MADLIPLDDLTRNQMLGLVIAAVDDVEGNLAFLNHHEIIKSIVDNLMAQQVPTLNPTRSDYTY